MHSQVMDFFTSVKQMFPEHFDDKAVLDFGALNINGSIRSLFTNSSFTGIDWRPGPDVDIVSLAHEYKGNQADVVICTEMLEHDPYWKQSVVNMVEHIGKGGMILISCANEFRKAHCLETAPINNYYSGISSLDLHELLLEFSHKFLMIVNNDVSHDVYVVMIFK